MVNDMLYKTLGCLFKMNNKIKKDKTEGEEAPGYAAIPESSSVVNSSTAVELCVVVTTRAVDNKKEHKHAAPRGSPSKFRK